MSKIRKQRQKFHNSAPKFNLTSKDIKGKSDILKRDELKPENNFAVEGNIFEGLNIDLSALNKKLSDDTISVKSFKSIKSDLGIKQVSKKDKLKLRKKIFLKKIDTVQQMKKETKKRRKRKNVAIIGDTNPLHDALPDLQSLLKDTTVISTKSKSKERTGNSKPIQKASRRKKEAMQNLNAFKMLMKDKQFVKNPLQTISLHIKAKAKSL